MPSIKVNISFDTPQAVAKIKAAADEALTITGKQAIEDIRPYVPVDQNTLERSADSNSDKEACNGEFDIRYSTPYAQYLWHGDVMHGNPAKRTYGPEKLSFTNAMAREEWAKYAAEIYDSDWQKVYEAALRKGLSKK